MAGLLVELIEFIAMLLFLRALVRGISALFKGPNVKVRTWGGAPRPTRPAELHRGEMVRDPVCGMFVSTELPHTFRRGKETLHFCSSECLERYEKDPANVTS